METTINTESPRTSFDRASFQLQNANFQNSHHHQLCIFTSISTTLIEICTRGDPLLPQLQHAAQPSLCSHPLVGLHKHSANVDECLRVPFFSAGRISYTPLLHTHSHVRCCSVRLPLCCHCTAMKCNRVLVGRFNLFCLYTNICL